MKGKGAWQNMDATGCEEAPDLSNQMAGFAWWINISTLPGMEIIGRNQAEQNVLSGYACFLAVQTRVTKYRTGK
jgi:hypothetical protein